MKKLFLLKTLILGAFIGLVAPLHGITLKVTVKSEGEILMAPTMNVPFEKPGVVKIVDDNQKGLILSMLPTKINEAGDEILIQCELSELANSEKNIITSPVILTKMGRESVVKVKSADKEFSIAVTPTEMSTAKTH